MRASARDCPPIVLGGIIGSLGGEKAPARQKKKILRKSGVFYLEFGFAQSRFRPSENPGYPILSGFNALREQGSDGIVRAHSGYLLLLLVWHRGRNQKADFCK